MKRGTNQRIRQTVTAREQELQRALRALIRAARGIERGWEHNLTDVANELRIVADEAERALEVEVTFPSARKLRGKP